MKISVLSYAITGHNFPEMPLNIKSISKIIKDMFTSEYIKLYHKINKSLTQNSNL